MLPTRTIRRSSRSPRSALDLARRGGSAGWSELESLEARQHLSLAGVTLTQFPRGAFDATGVTAYEAASQSFDVVASPTSIRLSSSTSPVSVSGIHGDVQIHAKVDSAGNLVRGVNPSEAVSMGSVNGAGDDLVIVGTFDADGDSIPDYSGVLLTGEIYSFGSNDGGGTTDTYDFRFVPTGGLLLALFPAGADIGVTMTSEGSTFAGSFASDFGGGAKGSYGPINAAPGSISGFKYNDLTGNGITGDDTPLSGVLIYIDSNNNGSVDPGEPTTSTAPDGSYSFTGLTPGTYVVRELAPVGSLRTVPGGDGSYSVTLSSGQSAASKDFANTILVSISGAKYKDLTGDGLTGGDTPLAGTTVYLDSNNNGVRDPGEPSAVTAGDGTYSFTSLPPGAYVVREIVPPGYAQTAPAPTGSYSVSLVSGQAATGKNFANYLVPVLGSIRGTKWFDATGNGASADDAPLGGTTIYLDLNNDGVKNSGEPSTITDADGTYSFESLAAGTYIVRELVPANMVRTGPALEDRHTVSLGAGQTVTGIDFTNAEKCVNILTSVQYWVNGVMVSNLRGNTNAGDNVQVIFTIPAGAEDHVFTLVSYTAPSSTFVAADAYLQQIYDIDTGLFGPGTHTLTVQIPDSFYQVDFVCGEAIDAFGPAGSNIFYSPQCRLISADNDGCTALRADDASISGIVWFDQNCDGVIDADEIPIQGAKITVSWVQNGSTKSITRYTNAEGRYQVGNLNPAYTYKVAETQPSGFADGVEFVGSAGGSRSNDRVSNITLHANEHATDYNFSEFVGGDVLGSKDIAAVSFWIKSDGQNLIKSLNGSSSAQRLGVWLAETFPNLFGSGAGSYSLDGKTNSQVASAIISRAANSATKLEAEVLAAALSIYVTNSAYAGGTMASSFGFRVNLAGSGFSTYSTGGSGSLLGLGNNTSQILFDLISGADRAASNGIIYSGNSSARTNLYNYFRAMNAIGGIK
ncbi:MAG TPA: SdrD B-like domain-containing protein [Phycisphaerales bacterium]|nr:SdrD B-like domain-containing protein [Phycisphaerales bacterium]